MSHEATSGNLSGSRGRLITSVLAGVLVTAVARLLVAGLTGTRAGAADAVVAGLTGGVAMGAVEWMRARRVARGWRIAAAVVAVPTIAVFWVATVLVTSGALTLGQALYAIALAALALGALGRGTRAVAEEKRGAELSRLLGVGLVALWIVHPYVTDRIVGGEDARWYASVFEDFLAQWRQGVFPVFVGQGENGFNGVVHLFRSAPAHLYLGGVLDALTWRSLGPVAVQHATVLVAALAAGFGTYFGLLMLVPGARWRAAVAACLYVLCPGVVATLICSDMFMTFMAVPLLPLMVIGNVRAARPDHPRYGLLAVVLALAWYCHPPLALWGLLISAVAQAGVLAGTTEPGARVRAAIPAAMLFVGLTCFYFVSMSEVPALSHLPLLPGLMQIGGMVLLGVGLARWLAEMRWRELGWSAAGLAVLGGIEPAWFLWGATATVVVLLTGIVRGRHASLSSHGRFVALFVAFAVGLVAAAVFTREVLVGRSLEVESLRLIRAKLDVAWRPIQGPGGRRWSEFQLGWSLFAALGAGAVAVFIRRRAELRWIIVPVAVLVLADFPVSRASDFFVVTFPTALAEVLSFPLFQRELPVLAALATVGGFLAISGSGGRPALRRAGAVALGLALLWSLAESRKVARFARNATASRDETAAVLRPENLRRLRYSYDLVAWPRYFQDAWLDWRMESRVLDARGAVVVGPVEIAEAMREATPAAKLSFTATADRDHPRMLVLAPVVTVPPRSRILLRIAFARERESDRLLVTGRRTGREVFLPAVPADGARAHVVSLVNSGDEADAVRLTFLRARAEPLPAGDFADAEVIRYDESRHPISVESLMPYRARVRSPQAGTLELPRVFVPGYRAWVDGQEAEVRASSEHLVAVPIPAGEHQVRVAYVGTTLSWAALAVSAATLLVAAGFAVCRWFAR